MTKILSFLPVILLLICSNAKAIDLPEKITDHTFVDNIRTVNIYKDGWPLSNPIIVLNSTQKIVLTFDDLSNRNHNYYYTIYHCTHDWKISSIPQQEYLPVFTEYPIIDRAYSVNTKIGYINYMLKLPNEDVSIIYSGNYALVVFDIDEPSKPVLIRRFFVVEDKVNIDARIRPATFDNPEGQGQKVDVKIDYSSFPTKDPYHDMYLVITQNNRSDNAITGLRPVFASNGILDYNYNSENVFIGENEFRYFEIRDIKHPGEGVTNIGFEEPCYYAELEPHHIRTQERYRYYREMNGRYMIEANNASEPEIQAEYMLVYLTLPMDHMLLGGGVYVFGAFNNWECNHLNEMKWNPQKSQYEGSLLLKQGFYNFLYAYMDDKTKKIKCYNLEGSFSETENDYQVYLYYTRISERYDRLIGYKVFNSNTNRAFANSLY
jgi:hypothetical protein